MPTLIEDWEDVCECVERRGGIVFDEKEKIVVMKILKHTFFNNKILNDDEYKILEGMI